MMLDANVLHNILEETARSLEVHLQRFNPVLNANKNGIPEANLTLQFAHQCLNKGWFVYPETSNVLQNNVEDLEPRQPIRVDLHVICAGQFTITVEAKKFYSSEKAREIINDYQRAQNLNYDHQYRELPHYVLLLAITEIQDYQHWWCHSDDWDNQSEVWRQLATILQAGKMITGSFPVNADNKTHHLLYAMARAE